jgi:hypothetical protein
MIWELFLILAAPEDYAITYRNGEFYVERIECLRERKAKIR